MTRTEIQKYVAKVRHELRGPRKDRKKFLSGLIRAMEEAVELNPDVDAVELFGPPDKVAQEFVETMVPVKYNVFPSKRFVASLVLAAFLMITAASVLTLSYKATLDDAPSYVESLRTVYRAS